MLLVGLLATPALAQVDPNSGIDFVRVTSPNNPAWQGDGTIGDRAVGRGSVGYEYSIGKFEVTTSQWVEFFNAAYDRPANDRLPNLTPPGHWGAVSATPNTPGGQRWAVPAGNEMMPVGNISWRMAAMYCNWLCNGKSTDRAAFMNGAYDATTFTYFGNIFQDQLTHNPGAQYWIPTWDEWLKAAHYDPNKPNPDGSVGGYWTYSTSSDVEPIPGVPGVGQCNAGGGNIPNPFGIPLGAYPQVQSPWGLLDVAGGTSEWTEEVYSLAGGTRFRFYDGSWWSDGPVEADRIDSIGAQFPSISTFDLGFRIASSVPSPSAFSLTLTAAWPLARRRRP